MPTPIRRLLLLALLALLVGAPATAASLADANAAARDFVRATMKARGIPGLQVAVVRDGRVVFLESHGLANVENRVPVEPTTLFPINSATKAFTGVAVMQLVQAGRVDLEAPISTYLADLPPAWRAIRVRQLLAHTSGLPDIVDAQGLVGTGTEPAAWQAVAAMPLQAAAGASPTTRPTTGCWRGSSKRRARCHTRRSSPNASSRRCACAVRVSATVTTW